MRLGSIFRKDLLNLESRPLSHSPLAPQHIQPQGPGVEQKHTESTQQNDEACCFSARIQPRENKRQLSPFPS